MFEAKILSAGEERWGGGGIRHESRTQPSLKKKLVLSYKMAPYLWKSTSLFVTRVREILASPFKYLNRSFRFLFLYFISWNPYFFKFLQPEKSPFSRNLPV